LAFFFKSAKFSSKITRILISLSCRIKSTRSLNFFVSVILLSTKLRHNRIWDFLENYSVPLDELNCFFTIYLYVSAYIMYLHYSSTNNYLLGNHRIMKWIYLYVFLFLLGLRSCINLFLKDLNTNVTTYYLLLMKNAGD